LEADVHAHVDQRAHQRFEIEIASDERYCVE